VRAELAPSVSLLVGTPTALPLPMQKLVYMVRKQSGQSLVEYSLVLALIAVVSVLVLKGLGHTINNTLSSVNANLP
jgi:Flp pilus assembly pilin Flp